MSLDYFHEMKEMVRCVELYYTHQKQQREIAQELEISPSKVSRLLKRAYDEGFIQVDFNFPSLPRLAAHLIEKKSLRDAVVIPAGVPEEIKEDIGRAAGRYFERIASPGVRVGISCGFTLYYMIKHLREGRISDIKIYPLASEGSLRSADILPNTLVGMMAAKYRPKVTAYVLPTYLTGSSGGIKSGSDIWSDPEVKEVCDAANNVDVALIGVGAVDPDTPGFCALAYAGGLNRQQITSLGAVGEFNYQPLGPDGEAITDTLVGDFVKKAGTVSLKRLREMSVEHGKTVIAIGGGKEKLAAIGAVLKGKLCNVLITDQDVAEALLKE
ncbi:MAG: sugar-binding domain-containing protein [Pyrinomonadaceae bacterium]